MKKQILFVIAAVMLAFSIGAKTQSGLGLHFGSVSGNGFSYRMYKGDNGWQATLGALSQDEGEPYFDHQFYDYYNTANRITISHDDRRNKLNLGLNYIRSLASNSNGRFYVFGGGSYLMSFVKMTKMDYIRDSSQQDFYILDPNQNPRKAHEMRGSFYAGAGLGFELRLGRDFRWALELPLSVNEDTEFTMYIPQTGFYYFFH